MVQKIGYVHLLTSRDDSVPIKIERSRLFDQATTTSPYNPMRNSQQGQLFLPFPAVEQEDQTGTFATPTQQVKALHERAIVAGARHSNVHPGKEYPTTLTRLPLFPPTHIAKRRNTEKGDGWTPLPSSWSGGVVEKSGPALSIFDEDTLIAMIQIRSGRYEGHHLAMPIPTFAHRPSSPRIEAGFGSGADIALSSDGDCSCFVSVFSLEMLETWIRGDRPIRGWGGKELRLRDESISRLSAVLLRYRADLNEIYEFGRGPFQLFRAEYLRAKSATSASYYIQWEPLLSAWLASYRTYLDLGVRRTLTPLGKAIHRFLSSQVNTQGFSVGLDILFEAIGATGRRAQLKHYANKQLDKMIDCGFLSSAAIRQTHGIHGWVVDVGFANKSTSTIPRRPV